VVEGGASARLWVAAVTTAADYLTILVGLLVWKMRLDLTVVEEEVFLGDSG